MALLKGIFMRNKFNGINDVMTSDWFADVVMNNSTVNLQNRVLKSTKLEDVIYDEFLADSGEMQEINANGEKLLSTFGELSQDVFTSFYSIGAKPIDENLLSPTAKQFNKPILEKTFLQPNYQHIRRVCGGKDLQSFEASTEFSQQICDNLPSLMEMMSEMKTTEMVQKQTDNLREQMREDYEKYAANPNEVLEEKIVRVANKLFSKEKQAEDLQQKAHDSLIASGTLVNQMVKEAVNSALEKAEEVECILGSWGAGDGDSTPQQIKSDKELLQKIRANPKLLEVSRILGKYLNILADKRKNSFTYGLGQKYDITTGNNINLCLGGDLALLGTAETQGLFMKKHMNKSLKQYRKREHSVKGCGDIIVCIDESGSMIDDIAWAKAFALALLDIAMRDKRKCAVIRFDTDVYEHLFLPNTFVVEDMMKFAEDFLGGGTNFMKPLDSALYYMANYGFERADVVFITDGEAYISDEFAEKFAVAKAEHNFMVQGVLLDKEDSAAGESLLPFCDKIFRQSEMGFDEVSVRILSEKVG